MLPSIASPRRLSRRKPHRARRLQIEALERRNVLATLTVNTNSGTDAVDNDLTLGEAIALASGTSGQCLTDAEKGQIQGASFLPAVAGPFCSFNPFTQARWQAVGGVGSGVGDFIFFAANVSTISPTSQLPDVSCYDKIDGLAGRSSKVRLDGGSAGNSSGLALSCDIDAFTWIRNLEITDFQGDGITSFSSKSLFQGLELFENRLSGLHLYHVGDSTIGGVEAGQGNVIYANGGDGILLEGSGGNRIENNIIGLKPDGDTALGNLGHGINLFGIVGIDTASGNVIGGADPGAGNVISGNTGYGVVVYNGFATHNTIANNTIGLNAAQSAKRGNGWGGVSIDAGSSNNQILANLIAGNNGSGVTLENHSSDNVVRQNFIGTNFALATDLGNADHGMFVSGVARTTIDLNVIQSNTHYGIHITDENPSFAETVDNVIASNSISLNAWAGVRVEGPTSDRNRIDKNSISNNGGLGIDLEWGGNSGQNFPALSKAYPNGANTTVEGTLNSLPSTSHRIQFFYSGECDSSGYGEGQVFAGELVQSTDAGGNLSFTTSLATSVPTGQWMTATATNVTTGDTSEFSACRVVTPFSGTGSTLTWTGGVGNLWSHPKNWENSSGQFASPVGGERLIFPAKPATLQSQNDLTNLTFESITILGTDYSISGNSITVGTISSAEQTTNTLTLGVRPGAFYNVPEKSQLVLRGVTSGAGTVGLFKQGGGELVIDAFHTYAGVTMIAEGAIKIAVNGRIPDSSSVYIAAGSLLDLNGFSDTIGSLAGAGSVQLGGGALDAGLNGESTTFSGVITGVGEFSKNGAGTLTLSGPNNYSGPTHIKLGNIQLGANNGIPNDSDLVIDPGAGLLLGNFSETVGSLDGGGFVSGNGSLTAGGNDNSTTFTGTMGGFGTFTKTGSGTMNVSGSLGMINNNIHGGTLRHQAHGVLGGGPLRIVRGTLDLNGFNQTIFNELSVNGGSIETGTGTLTLATNLTIIDDLSVGNWIRGNLSLGGATRTVNAIGSAVVTANISDGSASSGLTKTGSGSVTLGGANSYTGATRVEGGAIVLYSNLAASAVTVLEHGTLENVLERSVGPLTVSGGTVAPDQPLFANRLNTQTLTLNSGRIDLDFEAATDLDYDHFVVTGGATLNGNVGLGLSLEFDPQDNVDVFRIIRNDGTDPTVLSASNARFVYGGNVLEEGEVFQVKTGAVSQFFQIRYGLTAGDNDVRLVAIASPSDRIGAHNTYQFFQDVNGNGVWNGNTGGDRLVSFGSATDVPLIGDWNGDGYDEVGVKRGNQYYLDANGNNAWNGIAGGDLLITFGNVSDVPLAGDWDGDGDDQIGVKRGNQYYLDLNSNGAWNGLAGGDVLFTFGNPTDVAVIGDWDGDGDDQIGVQRGTMFYLDRNGNGAWNAAAGGDLLYNFGAVGDVPFAGDWNASGTDKIGVKRGNLYFLDKNGNGSWNGIAGGDLQYTFGNSGDRPIDGKWKPIGALLAQGGAASSSDHAALLTNEMLAPIVQQAITLWADLGLSAWQRQMLRSVHVAIADLPDAHLGLSLGGTILLDRDAAGYGWFVDPTPADNSEFNSSQRDSAANPPSASPLNSMDLLSVVLHELGHELGFEHDDDVQAMLETLSTGTRRLL